MKTSKYSGFFKLSVEDRMKEVAEFANLTEEDQKVLQDADSLDMDKADHMIENVIGRFALPDQRKRLCYPDGFRGTFRSCCLHKRSKNGPGWRWIYHTFLRNSDDLSDSAFECSDTVCSKEHDPGAQR